MKKKEFLELLPPCFGSPVFHRLACFINETTEMDRNEVRQNWPAYCRYVHVGMEISQEFIKSVYCLESTASLNYYKKRKSCNTHI